MPARHDSRNLHGTQQGSAGMVWVWIIVGLVTVPVLLAASGIFTWNAFSAISNNHKIVEDPPQDRAKENPARPLQPDEVPNLDRRFTVDELKHTGMVSALAYSPNGKHVAAGAHKVSEGPLHDSGDLMIWEVATLKQVYFNNHPETAVASLCFHPSGDYLAVCFSLKVTDPRLRHTQKPALVQIYEFPAMKETKSITFDIVADGIQFSPDGKTLAVSHDREVDTLRPRAKSPS